MAELTDLQLAYIALQREGVSREEAGAIVIQDPTVVERLAPVERQRFEAEVERRTAEAYAASPEGRARAADEAMERQAARARQVEGARALLAESGVDAGELDEREVLHLSGIEPDVELMSERQVWRLQEELAHERWPSLSEEEQRSETQRLGTSVQEVERYRATVFGGDGDDE